MSVLIVSLFWLGCYAVSGTRPNAEWIAACRAERTTVSAKECFVVCTPASLRRTVMGHTDDMGEVLYLMRNVVVTFYPGAVTIFE
jgi:hypothetical protein